MHPRLHLDIGWGDLASVFAPLGAKREDLEARVAAAWPAHAFPALSVRTAFDAALTVLNLPQGSAVAMSAVTIQNMADVVRAHGLTPAPVDIDLATLAPRATDLDRVLSATGARLYVHAHLYGARNDLSDIAAICRAHGALLIEDCAQGYPGAPPPAASVADIALYSFGPIKARTCLGGAVALCRDPGLKSDIAAVLAKHASMPERWLRVRVLKYAALKLLSIPALYGVAIAALNASGRDPDAAIGGTARGFRGPDLINAIRRAPSRALLRLMARRMSQPTDATWRTRAGAALEARIGARLWRPGGQATSNAFWLYPLLVDDPERAARTLRRVGFDATRGATSLRVIGEEEEAPNAALLMRHVLYLPLLPTMPAHALARMAETVCATARPPTAQAPRLAA